MGITLLVFGLLATFGPLAFDLGGTDSPPADEPADDPPGADASDASGDGTSGAEGNDGIGRTIDDVISGSDEPESAHGDEEREECFVE